MEAHPLPFAAEKVFDSEDLDSRELAEVFGGEETGRGGFVGHVG